MRIFGSILVLVTFLAVSGCTTSAPAASSEVIDAEVKAALARFYKTVQGGDALMKKANGALIFPNVVKAGIGVGGEYGEGALLVNGNTVDYYSTASASIGFQLGAQVKTEVILFMEPSALKDFQNSQGWEAGVDGSVALVVVGAGGEIDTNSIRKPIIGFIISNKGLMYNLTFEGSKITKIDR